MRSAETAGQRAASATEILYGVLSVAVLLAMAFRRRWVTPLLVAWGGALTVTGALAAVVWGEAEWWAGAIGGAGVLAVVALVVWAWRAHLRGTRAGAPLAERRPPGVTALAVFFAAGSMIALVAAVSLLSPGGFLEPMWR